MMRFDSRSLRNPSHVAIWLGLAFQAGAINAGGFLACHSFVSHVTGVGTGLGISLASRDLVTAVELLAIPGSFCLGAMLSAWLIDRRRIKGEAPMYVSSMAILFGVLAVAQALGLYGVFGPFGEPFRQARDVALLSLLCFACGQQNATIVSATQGMIRTTHLTGILTDLGINLVKVRSLAKFSRERYREVLINRIRIGTFVSFSLGSMVSALIFSSYGYAGFSLPVGTSLGFFLISFFHEAGVRKVRETATAGGEYSESRVA